jgi:hypothetical protein
MGPRPTGPTGPGSIRLRDAALHDQCSRRSKALRSGRRVRRHSSGAPGPSSGWNHLHRSSAVPWGHAHTSPHPDPAGTVDQGTTVAGRDHARLLINGFTKPPGSGNPNPGRLRQPFDVCGRPTRVGRVPGCRWVRNPGGSSRRNRPGTRSKGWCRAGRHRRSRRCTNPGNSPGPGRPVREQSNQRHPTLTRQM